MHRGIRGAVMAIHIYCTKCYTSNGLNAKACSNCGTAFGRDKKYRVCVSVKGKRETRVVDNLTLARQKEATLKADLERDEMDIKKKKKKVPTLGEVWSRYLPWAQANKKSWKDDSWYYVKHIEGRFAKKTLDSISSFDIEKLKNELRKEVNRQGRPYAAQTIKHQLCIIRRLYNLARKWDLYDGKNPVDAVTMPRVDNKVTECLSDEELRSLLDTLDKWPCKDTVAFIRFALLTGLRKGELCKLQWDDCDLDRGLLTLRDAKSGTTEHVPVSMEALKVLRSLEATSTYVFPGAGGKKRTNFSRPWQKIRRAAGLPEGFRFHGLRHHFASTLVSNGIDLLVVQKLLTHKDAKTTQRYAHLSPGALKDAAVKSGELLTLKPSRENVINLAE
jgi:integrase